MPEMKGQLPAKIVFEQKTTMQWDEVNEIIPSGLLIVYADEGKNRKIKIGNGKDIPKNLPFLNNELSDILVDSIVIGNNSINDNAINYLVQGNNNKIISKYSSALGTGNIAGLRGFLIVGLNTGNKTVTLNTTEGLEIGDIVSIRATYNEYNFGKITAITNNVLTLDIMPNRLALDTSSPQSNQLWVFEKPEIGDIDIGGPAAAIGYDNYAYFQSFAEGFRNKAYGRFSHAEGRETSAAYSAHSEGRRTKASGEMSHSEGMDTEAKGFYSHAQGSQTVAHGEGSFASGMSSSIAPDSLTKDAVDNLGQPNYLVSYGYASHAEGQNCVAFGKNSHSEGLWNIASGDSAHAEGRQAKSTSDASHAEGHLTYASAPYSHAEGMGAQAMGPRSHAEGWSCIAQGDASHAEGKGTRTIGKNSHAEGLDTEARADQSHAEGYGCVAGSQMQHVEGRWNVIDESGKYVHITGWGDNDTARKNVYTLARTGDAWYSGELRVGGTSYSTGSRVLTTKDLDGVTVSTLEKEELDATYLGITDQAESAKIADQANIVEVVKMSYNPDPDGDGEEEIEEKDKWICSKKKMKIIAISTHDYYNYMYNETIDKLKESFGVDEILFIVQ